LYPTMFNALKLQALRSHQYPAQVE